LAAFNEKNKKVETEPSDSEDKNGDMGKQDEIVKNSACRRIFSSIRFSGTILMLISLMLDYTYIWMQTFSSKLYYLLFFLFLALRAIIPAALLIRYQMTRVMGDKNVLTRKQFEDASKNGLEMQEQYMQKKYKR
jgi:hypothetical protein